MNSESFLNPRMFTSALPKGATRTCVQMSCFRVSYLVKQCYGLERKVDVLHTCLGERLIAMNINLVTKCTRCICFMVLL